MVFQAIQFCLALQALGYPRADYACEHMSYVMEASEQNDIKPEVFLGLIMTESNWNHKVVSYAGACGLTQVLPKYSKKYGGKDRNLTCDELKDPVTSIQVGGRILNYWLTKYSKGNYKVALCGYNAGFRCKGDNPNKQGMRYAKKVLQRARTIKRKALKFKGIKKLASVVLKFCP
jgi:soluble lytic murein transglycosylase-like protein